MIILGSADLLILIEFDCDEDAVGDGDALLVNVAELVIEILPLDDTDSVIEDVDEKLFDGDTDGDNDIEFELVADNVIELDADDEVDIDDVGVIVAVTLSDIDELGVLVFVNDLEALDEPEFVLVFEELDVGVLDGDGELLVEADSLIDIVTVFDMDDVELGDLVGVLVPEGVLLGDGVIDELLDSVILGLLDELALAVLDEDSDILAVSDILELTDIDDVLLTLTELVGELLKLILPLGDSDIELLALLDSDIELDAELDCEILGDSEILADGVTLELLDSLIEDVGVLVLDGVIVIDGVFVATGSRFKKKSMNAVPVSP